MRNGNQKYSTLRYFTPAILLIVALLAACNWYFQPNAMWKWIISMLVLPAIWGCMTAFKRLALRNHILRSGEDSPVRRYSDAAGRFFLMIIGAVGLIQMISLSFKLAANLGMQVDPDFPGRIKMFGIGIVFILLGNALPKILTPQSLLPDGGALRIATARRFLGWTWVLLGLTMALISFFLPFELMQLVGKWTIIVGTLAILGGIVWINLGPRRRQV